MGYFNLIKLNATSSTNDFLKERRVKGECKEGDLVWTKHQTAGRGQRNKVWESAANTSLAMSIYKTFEQDSPEHPFAISSAVATRVVDALTTLQVPELSIKWPNDILSGNRKIGGILIENTFQNNRLKNVIIGFGLNVNQTHFNKLPFAASLFTITKEKQDFDRVFTTLVESFEQERFLHLEKHQKLNLDTLNSQLWRKDMPSFFQKKEQIFEAVPLRIKDCGSLAIFNLETNQEEEIDDSNVKMLYRD
jgi:BirA family biotin operon repressor/biotin-[acetyl-CoA-carboxylase] ligase